MADTTTGVGGTNSADALTSSANQVNRNVGGTLGKDDFLKLLVGQMKNMDPLSSDNKDPSETMAQMTQYSMLEQMQNLNASTQALADDTKLSSTIALIGHSVTYSDDQGNPVQGRVETVQTAGSKVTLTIDGTAGIDPTKVIEVR
jgi:flagellar basal-body rod modification protein FlgD